MLQGASHNTANNDTPFLEMNYGGRSTVLLTENLSFDSSQNGGVVCRDAIRKQNNDLVNVSGCLNRTKQEQSMLVMPKRTTIEAEVS